MEECATSRTKYRKNKCRVSITNEDFFHVSAMVALK
jgi:hypothetical protein